MRQPPLMAAMRVSQTPHPGRRPWARKPFPGPRTRGIRAASPRRLCRVDDVTRRSRAVGGRSMPAEATAATVELFTALLAAAVLVALVSRRIGIPYTVALVLFGLAVATFLPGRRWRSHRSWCSSCSCPGWCSRHRSRPISTAFAPRSGASRCWRSRACSSPRRWWRSHSTWPPGCRSTWRSSSGRWSPPRTRSRSSRRSAPRRVPAAVNPRRGREPVQRRDGDRGLRHRVARHQRAGGPCGRGRVLRPDPGRKR